MEHTPYYGVLSSLNTRKLILDAIGSETLESIALNYLNILGTSTAIYEANGDYALGIFSSGWCRLLDEASRKLCNTNNNKTALLSGKWLCHESCWTDCSKTCIEKQSAVDIACHGGIHLYCVPIFAGKEIVGAINFGYGDPPQDMETINEIAEKYNVDPGALLEQAKLYVSRSPEIIEAAKHNLETSAKLIGAIIESKQSEEIIRNLARFPSENPSPVLRVDTNGIILYANAASDFLLERWNTTIGEKVPSQLMGHVKEALASETSKELDRDFGGRHYHISISPVPEKGYVNLYVTDITERISLLTEQNIVHELIIRVAASKDLNELLSGLTKYMKKWSGCEAVGIRLQDEDDFPYYETSGFPEKFVRLESSLCAKDAGGNVMRDIDGSPVLDCMCGNVIRGRFDSTLPFFTEKGSFWSNCTTELLASTTEEDRQARTRNRCNGEGYESVALIALNDGEKTYGLLQFNDKRKNRFTPRIIATLERVAQNISLSITRWFAQEELRENEKRFRSIIENTEAGYFFIDKEGVIRDVNHAWANMYGYSTADEIVGRHFTEVQKPEDVDAAEEFVRGILNGKPDFMQGEFSRKHKNGETGFHSFSARPVLKNNEPIGIEGFIIDTTSKWKAAEEIRKSEEKFRSLYESMNEGIAIHDIVYDNNGKAIDYEILDVNRQFEIVTGLRKEDVCGKHATEAYQAKEPPYLEHYARVAETGEPEVFETYFPPMEKHFRISVFSPGKGSFNTVFIDITGIKKAEERERLFHEQEKMAAIGRVAGKMAHDFNNVLGITLGASELLLSDSLPPEIRQEIEAIRESAIRGREITQNLLFFAKDRELKYSTIDLNRKVESVVRAMRSDLAGIKIHIDYGIGLDRVVLDEGLFNNALINLIQNSIHALSKVQNPELHLATSKHDSAIVFEISDNGCGIPIEDLDKIYDPSFTLKGSMDKRGAYSRDIKGSGYGLANVKRAVDKHGGKISLSTEVGVGTSFRIEIPIIEAEPEQPEPDDPIDLERTGCKKILVVEDEFHFGNVLYRLLRKHGHKVNLASNGAIALDQLADNSYDLVSLDFVLPDMNGIEVYRRIRATDKNVPIIFVSGNFEFMQSMIDLKNEDSLVDHISKPFNNTEFVKKVHDWLE